MVDTVNVKFNIEADPTKPEDADKPMFEGSLIYRGLPQDKAQAMEFGGADGIIAAIKKAAGFSD